MFRVWFDEINERRLFRELGYASINQYAEQEFGFSSSRTGDYLQLCRSFKKLPQRRPAAVVPVRVGFEMTPTQLARYEKLWERIRKQRNIPADKVEALLAILEDFSTCQPGGKTSTRVDVQPSTRPPVQIHVHQCPECEKATVQTSKGELDIGQADRANAIQPPFHPPPENWYWLEIGVSWVGS